MRKYITIGIGLLLLVGAFLAAQGLSNSKKAPKKKVEKVVKTVFTETVKNKAIPIVITASGNLEAKNKVEIYSEVQGVLKRTSKEFKPGEHYQKGETLLHINSREYTASLLSERSNLYNLIISMLPDLRIDFPEAYTAWESYLQKFDMNKVVPALPEPQSEKEKFFISGKGIFSRYYNVKNMEVRLEKYLIPAPFKGVLTESLVTQGTLVRAGQKLGEFIDPKVYEMEVSVNASYIHLLKVGKSVSLHDLKKAKSWKGKVVRVNGRINQESQTVQAYIQLNGDDLKEGMYLEASLAAKEEENAYQVSRKLLIDNSKLYVVKKGVLMLKEIQPVFFNEKTVVIKGLKDGDQLLSKTVPGAYAGMPVKIFTPQS
ncbi:efflux RND transporter periplasmic adaptor subunit [Xanthovirga aplysinae]|uniref:efflux RND transporter periplasmic adaptor subunit n=1 Tax=Xanthovirga aplysinae TaxID=2529853 RepID=UPI0012BC13B3|nr:HlyD family efflux transporter periplasmic adaptor subunit [Xanthovirga aplysinae]MTI31372.1 HlyD family efflux transporter periplasmic adaptor subunit [Xanthovirga aplysinae]